MADSEGSAWQHTLLHVGPAWGSAADRNWWQPWQASGAGKYTGWDTAMYHPKCSSCILNPSAVAAYLSSGGGMLSLAASGTHDQQGLGVGPPTGM